MKVLIVKTSSLGDLIHTLPALSDAKHAYPDIEFHWLCEEAYEVLPYWHPAVKRVITLPWRRVRKQGFRQADRQLLWESVRQLRKEAYDYIIDAQGLIKSAVMTRLARGKRCGLDAKSARESLASWFYQKKVTVDFQQHAVWRNKQLFSKVLNYEMPQTIDWGIASFFREKHAIMTEQSFLFLHGTVWETKQWPIHHWKALAKLVVSQGYEVKLLWGNEEEKKRAQEIASVDPEKIRVMPRLELNEIAELMLKQLGVVSVDTGLSHLAAALEQPNVSLYGPTDPRLTAAIGKNQLHLQSHFHCSPCFRRHCLYSKTSPPCFDEITVEKVWGAMLQLLKKDSA